MPSIYYMNTPSHPFWDFVQEMNDRPFWGGPPGQHTGQDEASRAEPQAEATREPNAQDASVADPPVVDPSTLRPETHEIPFRGRGGRHGRCGGGEGHGHEGRRGRGWGGPFGQSFPFGQAFGPQGHPFGPPPHGPHGHHGPPGPPGPHPHGPHDHHGPPDSHQSPPPPGAEPHHHGGPRGRHSPPPGFGHRMRGGPHHRGGPGHHHPHGSHEGRGPCGRRGRHGPGGPPGPAFNLHKFITDLGGRIGMDLQGAAEGLGLERFMDNNRDTETDFEPRADIFEREPEYIVHVSLPGAKKEDVGVDWDGEHSVLRVAGVVHRPGVDEEMLEQLIVDGRKREVGVFEKAIKLGSRSDPASIDVAGIKAKMIDGVLVIRVPKVEVEHKKRDVPISSSKTPSPQRSQTIFDADHEIEMHDAQPEVVEKPQVETHAQTGNGKEAETYNEKELEHNKEKEMQVDSTSHETLPVYQAKPTAATSGAKEARNDSDWEHDGSDDEGEYIKINVD